MEGYPTGDRPVEKSPIVGRKVVTRGDEGSTHETRHLLRLVGR